jgi:hypothetical protein
LNQTILSSLSSRHIARSASSFAPTIYIGGMLSAMIPFYEQLSNYPRARSFHIPDSSLKTALLYLERARKKSPETLFFPLSERGDLLGIRNQAWFKDLQTTLPGRRPQIGFSGQVPTDAPWNLSRYTRAVT